MKQIIDCNKTSNPLIKTKLRKVSIEEGLVIAEELFQILVYKKVEIHYF